MVYYFLVFLSFFLDRITKLFAFWNRDLLLYEVKLLPYVVSLKYAENYGVAFGLFEHIRIITILLPLLFVFVFYLFIKNTKSGFYLSLFCLILGGFLGNLFDRVVYGYVIDMILFPLVPLFVCNIADIIITCAMVVFSVHYFFKGDA